MEDQINFKEPYIHFLLKQENVIFVLMDFQGEVKTSMVEHYYVGQSIIIDIIC